MPIPDFQSIMLPLLQFIRDKEEHSMHDITEYISKIFNLTDEERTMLLSSGHQTIIRNRTGWARTYLKKAGLLEITRSSYIRITERGLEVLKGNPQRINIKFLEQFPEFIQFKKMVDKEKDRKIIEGQKAPNDLLEEGYRISKESLAQDLLAEVKKASPDFFQKLVVDLLVKMGYGGDWEDAAKVIGKSGDEGIDGVINQDKLGLDVIYIQAKKWEGTVGRPVMQAFVGALDGKKATKGVFITTSNFTKEAIDYLSTVPKRIILVDDQELIEQMIKHDIGVKTIHSYEIKKIDPDYFTE